MLYTLPQFEKFGSELKRRLDYATKGKTKKFLVLTSLFLVLSVGSAVRAQILNEGSTMEEIEAYAKSNPAATPQQLDEYMNKHTVQVGDLSEGGAFTAFMNDMVKFAKNGMSSIKSAVKGLLVSLILIEFIITVSHWALSDQNRLGDLFWKFIKWGIYVYIVGNFSSLANSFLDGFLVIGKAIGGTTSDLITNPSNIFTNFWLLAVKPFLNYVFSIEYTFSFSGIAKNVLTFQAFPVIGLCVFFIAIINLILIVILAAQIVSTVAIYWFCATIGFILFPFMMLEQTRFLSGNVISALMGGGARMAVLTAVLGLGNGIIVHAIQSFGFIAGGDGVLPIALEVTAYMALFCWASIKLPSVVAAAVAGHGGGGMGIASGITKLATIGR